MEELFKKAGSLLKSFKDGFNDITAVNLGQVTQDIQEINIYSKNYPSEKECEDTILKHLRNKSGYKNVHRQFSVGGNLALKIDLDIDERIGIEIKLAEELMNASNAQRLLGQALYYSRRKYNQNIIIVVIGPTKLQKDPMLKEIQILIEVDLGLNFMYKSFK